MIKREKEKNVSRKSWGSRVRRTVVLVEKSCQRQTQRVGW